MYGRLAPVTGIVLGLMALIVPVVDGSAFLKSPLTAGPVGTAFTYQGQLKQGGAPASGPCDMQFSLFDAPTPTVQIGSTQTRTNVQVTNGLFTIPDLDFGNVFNGDARWLQIAVRCPAGGGSFTTLSPLVALTPTPYAMYASSAGTAASATSFTGGLTGDVTGTQGATTVARLQGANISPAAPTNNQVLQFSGGQWAPVSLPPPPPPVYVYAYGVDSQFPAGGADLEYAFVEPASPAGITYNATTRRFTVAAAGVYRVLFTIWTSSGGVFGVAVNGAVVQGATYPFDETSATTGQAMLALNANDQISVRNASIVDASIPFFISGPVFPANVSVSIEKLN